PRWVDLERADVVLEVAVVERYAQRVEPEGGEVRGVLVREEDVEQPVEERVVRVAAHGPQHRAAHLGLRRRVAGDEVLHVHPAPEAEPSEEHRPVGPDDRRAVDGERSRHRSVTAVHETGGRVIRSRPSSSTCDVFGARPTRSGSARVLAACMSSSWSVCASATATSPRMLVSTTSSTSSARLRFTRKTAVSPLSGSWVATAST